MLRIYRTFRRATTCPCHNETPGGGGGGGGGGEGGENVRVTDDGSTRITDDDSERVTE